MAKLNHIGIFTAHPRRLANFYVSRLGFTKSHEAILPQAVVNGIFKIKQECTMVKLAKDEVCLEVFWFKGCRLEEKRRIGAGYNHFGIEIEKREAFCNRLADRFKIKVTKIKRGDHYNYFIRDPDKNIIEIKGLAKHK